MHKLSTRIITSAISIILLCTFLSIDIYYFSDDQATFPYALGVILMGLFSLPFILLMVWGIDILLRKLSFLNERPHLLVSIDLLLALLLYIPGMFVMANVIFN